jgi:hypothetical protein
MFLLRLGDSVDGKKLWTYHANMIENLWTKNQVFVVAFSFDYGASNAAMCKELGVKASRTEVNVCVPLVMVTDPPHGLKGLKKMFLSHVMKLPNW